MRSWLFISLFCISGWSFGQDWCADYASAIQKAKEEIKPIVLVFSGSDWCAPCIKLERQIWTSEAFKEYASENLILYRADFPRKKKNQLSPIVQEQHRSLAERYNPKGYFPLVLVLNSDEKVLGSTGYKNLSPSSYVELLNSFLQ